MPNFSLKNWAIRQLGGVPAEIFQKSEKELEQTQQALQNAKTRSSDLEKDVSDLKTALGATDAEKAKTQNALDLLEWTHPYCVEFLAEREPILGDLVRNTIKAWEQIGKKRWIGMPHRFERGTNPAGLYWALTHASRCGRKALRDLNNEDAMTADFVAELRAQLRRATAVLGSSIDVHAGEISKKRRPALKEISVGADLLLLVSGEDLVPQGGVRLLWLQFKQTSHRGKPLELDVYRTPNAAGGTQFDALRRVHQPDRGSFGHYALASQQYNFFASVSVGELDHINPTIRSDCAVDLAKAGIRLQELILLHSTALLHGQFVTGEEVIRFVDNLASENAIIPLTVLSVASGAERIPTRELVHQITQTWERRLQYRIKALPGARREEPEFDDDDRYPSLGR